MKKITKATPEQKLKALAELDRWKPKYLSQETSGLCPPQYLTSYDAIIPLIQKQPVSIQVALDLHMRIEGVAFWTVATPTQLANALLVTTGKFEA
jgi:hypothetical protein